MTKSEAANGMKNANLSTEADNYDHKNMFIIVVSNNTLETITK